MLAATCLAGSKSFSIRGELQTYGAKLDESDLPSPGAADCVHVAVRRLPAW